MSFLSPSQYHNIAQELGKAYKVVRDGLVGSSITTPVITALEIVLDATDNVSNSTLDPLGAIAKDLGSKASDLTGKFTIDQACLISSAYFSDTVSALNNHVVNRSNTTGTKTYTNLAGFYTDNASLWTSDASTHTSYFSQEYTELVGYFGTTFSSTYTYDNDGAHL
jgi:hypothetical protein